jgi:fructose-1,6-bisphosphatase/inositol monophosphatase family enzyme
LFLGVCAVLLRLNRQSLISSATHGILSPMELQTTTRLTSEASRSLALGVLRAGKIIFDNSPANTNKPVEVEIKPDGSPVTRFDKISSKIIVDELRRIDPHGYIVSEEDLPTAVGKSASSWFVDPLDGTKQFIKGEPFYAIFVGRKEGDRFTFGQMYYPALGIFVRGGIGIDSCCISKNRYFSAIAEKKQPGQFIAAREEDYSGEGRIDFNFPTRNLPILSVVAGVAEAAVAKFLKEVSLWDISATLAIASAKGLSVTDLSGAPVVVNGLRVTSTGLLICQPDKRDQMLALLAQRA